MLETSSNYSQNQNIEEPNQKNHIMSDSTSSGISTDDGKEEKIIHDINIIDTEVNASENDIRNRFASLVSKKKLADDENFKAVWGQVQKLAKSGKVNEVSFMKNVLALNKQGIDVADFIGKQKKKFENENPDNGRELTDGDIAAIMSFDMFSNSRDELKKIANDYDLTEIARNRFLEHAFSCHRVAGDGMISSHFGNNFFFENPHLIYTKLVDFLRKTILSCSICSGLSMMLV